MSSFISRSGSFSFLEAARQPIRRSNNTLVAEERTRLPSRVESVDLEDLWFPLPGAVPNELEQSFGQGGIARDFSLISASSG